MLSVILTSKNDQAFNGIGISAAFDAKKSVDMKEVDVVIIGAGAAGLMCASQAGKRGRKILLLDKGKKPGRKILISGGGRCNFSNQEISAVNYICRNPHFVKSALAQYNQWDFFSLISEYSIEWEERSHGQLFCIHSAKDIVDMLLKECSNPNIEFSYNVEIKQIEKTTNGFKITLPEQKIFCSSLVIATGGLSMPKLGATPFGYHIADQFNLERIPTSAGLVPFTLHDKDKSLLRELSGISIPVSITTQNGVFFKENMLFTHRGLSGPVVLQASNYWTPGESITINLLPDFNLKDFLNEMREKHPAQSLKNSLSRLLPKRLIETLMIFGKIEDKPIKHLNTKELDSLNDYFHCWKIAPNGTEGYRTAEVTLGGVDTDELSSKTMEAKNVSGLYFIGEVMDVAGRLGGYNFQWAWSSGFVAGQNV